jgi:uridine kinase
MKREELLAFLFEEIVKRKEEGRPLKVSIDGRCASGKSVLADELAPALRRRGLYVLRPSVDGFHHPRDHRYRQGEYSAGGYYEDAFNYRAVEDYLLQPLSQHSFPVLCRQVAHDIRTDMPISAPPVRVEAHSVLLFDGVFLFRTELNAYWDFRILLEVDAATSISRAVERDAIDQPDVVRRKYGERYEPAWQIYVAKECPVSKADVIVDNRDFLRPQILKPVAVGSLGVRYRGK